MNQQKINQCVEAVCGLGCRTVSAIIRDMERGVMPELAAHLDPDETRAVLSELKSIMAVYGDKCEV